MAKRSEFEARRTFKLFKILISAAPALGLTYDFDQKIKCLGLNEQSTALVARVVEGTHCDEDVVCSNPSW